jgi:2-enoate reductase
VKPKYPKLFEPISIGKVTIKNRIAMAPMGILGLTTPDGSPAQRAIDYYIERARGGVGLIITSVFKVENEIEANTGVMHLINRASTGPFAEMCEAVHALGTRIFVQLTAGFGRVAPRHILRNHPVSASAVPHFHDTKILCRPLEIVEIEKIVKAFGTAADILVAAGVDGIELHGHEGYLFDQFTTALWNQRTDKYGGDLKQRLTLPVEVLKEIKQHAGADFPVQYRFGLKHYIKGLNSGALQGESYSEAGRDISEGLEMAKLLEESGFDALHVDAGCYDSWYWAHPPIYQEPGCMVDMAARVKQVVSIPVIAVGKLNLPEQAERVIAEGKSDMIAIGRGLLADSHWPVKVAESKTEDIRPCIGCHDGCIGRFMRGKPLSCAVNPACGREKLYKLDRVEKPKKVMIVGGGLAGLEAARVAAIRGHKVTLHERRKSLGGHLIEASVPGFKKDLSLLLWWYENQLRNLRVKTKLGMEVTESVIARANPDIVIIATGSQPFIPDIPGIEGANVASCIDVLLSSKKTGKTVCVIGGGLVGCETALWLAKEGKQVTLIEILPQLMAGGLPVPAMNRTMLVDLLAFNKVKVMTAVKIQKIDGNGVHAVDQSGSSMVIPVDTIVVAAGLKQDDALYKSLLGKETHLYAIGDCQSPRNIMGAVWDGFEVGREV